MNAELVMLGKRVSMAQRRRRRLLVIGVYAVLAGLLIAASTAEGRHSLTPFVLWAVIFACRLFLGGYYAGGLVKPFSGKPPRRSDVPPSLLALKLRIYQPSLGSGVEYRSDERELHQRDFAHYRAYKVLGIGLLAPWITASFLGNRALLVIDAAMVNRLCATMTLALLALFLTLPQAIMLWTEPDMDPGD